MSWLLHIVFHMKTRGEPDKREAGGPQSHMASDKNTGGAGVENWGHVRNYHNVHGQKLNVFLSGRITGDL